MGTDKPNLPVSDDEIETIGDWKKAIDEFLEQMYSMRLLCEIDPKAGTRFVHLKEAFGSYSTIGTKKNRATELCLIKPDVRGTEKGYGTHTYWMLTDVGRHIRAELQRRQIHTLHSQLKPLEHQMKSHRKAVENDGFEMRIDPLMVFYGDNAK